MAKATATTSTTILAESTTAWQILLKKIVNINSGTQNIEGLDAVRNILIPEFERLGFETEIHLFDNGHKLLSMIVPGGKPELVLMGHIDTVFNKDSSFQNFEIVNKDKIFGPGVIDMKGGVVMMIEVLKNFRNTDKLKKFMIIINDDEEIGSPYSHELVQKLGSGIKTGLVFEPGLKDGAVVTGHSGIRWLKLTVQGKAAHAGLEPEIGINACVELSHKVAEISKLTDFSKKLSVNVGLIKGGTKANVVCERAEALIDIRFVENDDLHKTINKIQDITDKHYTYNNFLQDAPTAKLEHVVAVPSMPESHTRRLFALLKVAGDSIGQKVEGSHVGYTSDANFLAETGMDLLVGLGPYGGGMHADNEHMLISTFEHRLKLNTALIKEILL